MLSHVLRWLDTLVRREDYTICINLSGYIVDIYFPEQQVVLFLEPSYPDWIEQIAMVDRWDRHDTFRNQRIYVFPLYGKDVKRLENGWYDYYSEKLYQHLYRVHVNSDDLFCNNMLDYY
jgi:hypothetical protein